MSPFLIQNVTKGRNMKVVLSLSGGMDSTAALSLLMASEMVQQVKLVSFYYGSKHGKYEMESAQWVAGYYGMDLTLLDISKTLKDFKSNLLLDQGEIPEGHYNDSSMSQTVVPCRNLIFLSFLAGYAESIGFSHVALGIHQGDHTIYPDCRPDFFNAAKTTVEKATDEKVSLLAPFLFQDKAEVVSQGLLYGAPFHLTRTCYKDQALACGVCGSCTERLEAFFKNNTKDPIHYAFDN